jgi:putative nucleotidyltransferase with HDIG domain
MHMMTTKLHETLMRALVAEGHGGRATLLAETLAHALAVRMTAAAERGSSLELIEWLERTSELYGAHAGILRMITSSCGIAREVFRRSRPAARLENLILVEEAIGAILRRRAAVGTDAEAYRLDEIESVLDAFIAKLDDKDPLSAEHSRAVSLWCRRIARNLGLDGDECTHAARSGLLHDVGKVSTPEEILLAPRALDAKEWDIMREHPAAGAAMVEVIPALRPFAPAVRSHHERLDGKGYPEGLFAHELPLTVRIVSVADSFNAMIARRPYRLPMSPVRALEELCRHRGTQFDPDVVSSMITVVEKSAA